MPFQCLIPDEPLPAQATLEFDALIYLCDREDVEPKQHIIKLKAKYLLLEAFEILEVGRLHGGERGPPWEMRKHRLIAGILLPYLRLLRFFE